MKLSLPWEILSKISQYINIYKTRIKIFILAILNITLVLLNIFSLKEYFQEKANFDALESNIEGNIQHSTDFDTTPFVHTIDSVNNFIYGSLDKRINLVSNEQSFKLLHEDNEKKFFLIEYKLQFISNYNELMKLLEKFSASKMIYQISDLSFNNENYSKLQIILNLKVLAYDNK